MKTITKENRHTVRQTGHIYRQDSITFYSAVGRMTRGNDLILDIGCGEGWLSIFLAALGNQVIGIDISDTAIALARQNSDLANSGKGKPKFERMDRTEIPFPPNRFDMVISTQFLEHLNPKDLITHLRNVHRILKTDGYYLCFTPNRYVERHQLGLHLRSYTYCELEQIFSRAGFLTRTTMLPMTLLSKRLLVRSCMKVELERVFRRLPVKALWRLVGLATICIIAFKAEPARST